MGFDEGSYLDIIIRCPIPLVFGIATEDGASIQAGYFYTGLEIVTICSKVL